MVSYIELGLNNTVKIFKKAMLGKYAIPGYNFNNMEQLQAIIRACVQSESPVILQVSKGAREYANETLLRFMAKGAVEYAKELHPEGKQIPITLHLDHGGDFEICKACIDNGFSSVMFDGSSRPYEENIKISQQVVEYAHSRNDYVSVECELGVLAGVEDEVSSEVAHYTKPEEVIDFKERTGCDSLAISIGTSHGANKFTPDQCTRAPDGTLVPQNFVKMINENGGALKDAVGIPEDQLRKAAKYNVCKINIDSDGRLAVTAIVRKIFAEKPAEFDPRKYLGPARDVLAELYARKNKEVLGSAGHAFD